MKMPEKREILSKIGEKRNGTSVRVQIVFGRGCNEAACFGRFVQEALAFFLVMVGHGKIAINEEKTAILGRANSSGKWGKDETPEMRTVTFDFGMELDLSTFQFRVLPGITEIEVV